MQNGINFQLMAKPPGAACNLRCDYCFYLEKIQLYPQHTAHRKMDDATLENYIRQTIAAQHAPVVDFIWQGGEPTLAGIDFYRRALELQQRYAQGRQINNFFQTNGVNLNDDWARFFKRHRFLVGLSLDGDSITHDRYRRSRAGKGTFNEVMAGLACLKRHHVDFNTLTVVNADNVARPKEIYHFLRRAGSRYMQFIPLVERRASEPDASGLTLVTPDFKGDCRVAPWSVPALAYGRFLNAIFDHWAQHDIGAIFVMNFEQTLAKLVGQPGICVQSETCGGNLVVEAQGDIYSCDHFVYPQHRLGNINHDDLRTLVNGEKQRAFGQRKLTQLNQACLRCDARSLCHGGCPKHRFLYAEGDWPQNYFCAGLALHYRHVLPVMQQILSLAQQGKSAPQLQKSIRRYYQGLRP
ncbi:anaerobic sulfatase maturase [Erwinia sp. DT-104]|uniref:Anaerobic sulfatase maturase n=1 Tax=Erwinia aeris TaxID=3239803 RepID=A0ABV4E3K4_9GAMM